MQKLKAFTAFITLSSFLTSGVAPVWAQAPATNPTGQLAVPNYLPASTTQFTASGNGLTMAIMSCDANNPLPPMPQASNGSANPAGAIVNKFKQIKKGKTDAGQKTALGGPSCFGEDGKHPVAKNQMTCDMTCPAPEAFKDGIDKEDVCVKYTGEIPDAWARKQNELGSSTESKAPWVKKPGGDEVATEAKEAITTFLDFESFKESTCLGSAFANAQKIAANANCKAQVLKQITTQAATQLQSILTQNQQMYTKSVQLQKQIGDQISQVDKILGNDKSPNGLLQIQKELTEGLDKWTADGATIQNDVNQIVQDTATNEQTLASDSMGQVDQCLEGNAGGNSYTCLKRASSGGGKDASGNPVAGGDTKNPDGTYQYVQTSCGFLDYIKSHVELAAYNGRRANANTAQQADINVSKFNGVLSQMRDDLGIYGAAAGNDPKQPSGDKLALTGNISTAGAFLQKYQAELATLPGYMAIAGTVSSAVNTCYNRATAWQNQQKNSGASKYSKKKADITKQIKTVDAKLNEGFLHMNQSYGTAMGVLTNGAGVSLNTTSCTTTDPAQMVGCYNTIKTGMTSILNGTGNVGVTTKAITGGSQISGFTVSCQGINKCVTAYQAVKDQRVQASGQVAKNREELVINGNATVQTALSNLGGSLASVQSAVTGEVTAMQALLGKSGIQTKGRMDFTKMDQLMQNGKGDEQTPFQTNDISGVLSSAMPPDGLMDFRQDSIGQILVDAQKETQQQKTDIEKDILRFQNSSKKIKETLASCSKDSTQMDKEMVAASKSNHADSNDDSGRVNSVSTPHQECLDKTKSGMCLLMQDPSFKAILQAAKATATENGTRSIASNVNCDPAQCPPDNDHASKGDGAPGVRNNELNHLTSPGQ